MSRSSLADTLSDTALQIEQRLQMGDRLEVARVVDHFAIFRSKGAASTAADALRALGYTVEVRTKLFSTTLEASKPERLDASEPDRFVGEVFEVVERNHGSYDGWGGEVEMPGD